MSTATMYQHELDTLIAAHKRSPQRCPAYVVALGLLMYRGQKGYSQTPKAFADMLGINYDVACRTLKDAREFLSEQPTTSVGSESDQTDHLGRSLPTTSVGSYRPPQSVPPHPPIEDKKDFKKDSKEHTPHAHAREADPASTSPEPDRPPVVDFVAGLTCDALTYWAAKACETYPAEWVEALAKRKILGAKRLPRIELLNSILTEWAAAGECEYLAAPIPLRATGTAGRPNPVRSLAEDLRDL